VYCSYKCSRAWCIECWVSVFHTLFNKITWLCGRHPRGDEASNGGDATQAQQGITFG
jgi:hypothetical protein